MEQKLRDLLAKYTAGDFCGCYDGDMDDRFPEAKEQLIKEILVLLGDKNVA